MTAGGDFIPGDQAFDEVPDYPTVFGVRLTPAVTGILAALIGLAGAGALAYYLVLPEWEAYQQLTTQVQQTEAEIAQQQQTKQKIEQAKKDLDEAKQQQQEVLTLFANDNALNTLLLDLNRQVDARNADLARRREQKLAQCPVIVRQNLKDFEDQAGSLVTKAELKTYTPVVQKSAIVNDGSFGAQVNGKLRREAVTVELTGNFEQTAAILQSIERLQPLLVISDLTSTLDTKSASFVALPGGANCVPEPRIDTKFQLAALLPLSSAEKPPVTPAQPAAAQPPK